MQKLQYLLLSFLLFSFTYFTLNYFFFHNEIKLNSVNPNTEYKLESSYELISIDKKSDTRVNKLIYNKHDYIVFTTVTNLFERSIIHNPDCNCTK